ncbi:hypothetical protein [Belnapia moabensis]|uniref:hypothetical protein n=1 Tax=Belnapia moabensis TaxID=365533 RepID=UPI0005BD76B6|nr:hypothetical protein [Belnapia moabensis]
MRSPFNRLGLSRLGEIDYIGLILAAPETAIIRQPDPIFESLEEILRQRASQPRRSTNKEVVERVMSRFRNAIARQDAREAERRRLKEEREHYLRTAPLAEVIAAARRKRDFIDIARARGFSDAWAHHRMLDLLEVNRCRIRAGT